MHINYPKLVDDAMRGIVAKALEMVAYEGMPGDHHFYISFSTIMLGVKLSERMREKYPEEITIVLQYQFEDLIVEKNRFSVSLHFDGIKELVVVPFMALTAFADPSAGFALQFKNEELIHNVETSNTLHVSENSTDDQPSAVASSSNIIALDQFRKKKK